MRIGIDIDNTLAMIAPLLVPRLNAAGADPPFTSIADFTHWRFFNDHGLRFDVFKREFLSVWRNELYAIEPEMPGFQSLIDTVRAAGHEVVIITAQWSESWVYQVQWLQLHQIVPDALIMLDVRRYPKWPLIDVLIDDAPQRALDVPAGKMLYLVDRPWNQDVRETLLTDDFGKLYYTVRRVASIKDAMIQILKRGNGRVN